MIGERELGGDVREAIREIAVQIGEASEHELPAADPYLLVSLQQAAFRAWRATANDDAAAARRDLRIAIEHRAGAAAGCAARPRALPRRGARRARRVALPLAAGCSRCRPDYSQRTVSSCEYGGAQQQSSTNGSDPEFQSLWRSPGAITIVSPAPTSASSPPRRSLPTPLTKW